MNRKSKKVTQMMRSLSPEPMGISMASINPQRRPLTYLSYNQNKLPIAFNITRTENIYNRNRKKEFTVSQCDQLSSISKKFNPANRSLFQTIPLSWDYKQDIKFLFKMLRNPFSNPRNVIFN